MKQWEAVHECQDERDAERLKKCAALTTSSLTRTKQLSNIIQFGTGEDVVFATK